MNPINDFLNEIRQDHIQGQDEINLCLTKEEFIEKMTKEKDGYTLLELLESGEHAIAERMGLIHGYRQEGEIYFEIASWNHLVAHLRIVNSV